MKYIILDINISPEEILERKSYLKSTYNVDFKINICNKSTLIFETNKDFYNNIIFLVGHCYLINRFLKNNKQLRNKIIIIDSCYINTINEIEKFRVLKVYVSKNFEKQNFRIDDTGWRFGITESEIGMFESKIENIMTRIRRVYIRFSDVRGIINE